LEKRKNLEFGPVESVTLTEAVYKEILSSILSGRIAPGEKLTLENLAEQLHVSIMPVREAIRKLEAGNLVSFQRNRRISVNQLSSENRNEIYETRLILESFAARKACNNFTDEKLSHLMLINNGLLTGPQNTDIIMDLNKDFHFFIYEQAQMPILTELISILWKKISPYFYIFFNDLIANSESWSIEKVFEYHVKLLKAISNRDENEVVKWLEMDMAKGMEYLKL
jgi:DNA-binding GntR family transcriptional regulator